ncbi:acid shock protein [Paenibacillus alvei]|uniref:acid shock protein n=1 Tax=Paenibacillus alvei TaxID=44250 RepID=UPI0018CF26BE|nr:acid shock protein [Paenibacillus alvei]MBG9737077.1 hypothetical protein [Paenibacillus alvei]MBG9742813.1 hypothetical protein [Paenibacillus alvei]MBG9746170.1 hypothetical protein [Paenibacillus alvei]MCY9579722.1 acid shock protein [Paenibacillus alvei]MCY9586375.1 acid shock protein [Paenibacillus alvei]
MKKVFALTVATAILLSSQVAMAAPAQTPILPEKTTENLLVERVEIVVPSFKVGGGTKLYGSNFWISGSSSDCIYLDREGNVIGTKPGQASVSADLRPGVIVVYYITVTN